MRDSIVVSGIDCISNLGMGVKALRSGGGQASFVPLRINTAHGEINTLVGKLGDADIARSLEHLSSRSDHQPRELCAALVAHACIRACDQAAVDIHSLRKSRIGLVLGNLEPVSSPCVDFRGRNRSIGSLGNFRLVSSETILEDIVALLGIETDATTIVNSACASGNVAFLLGAQLLQDGMVDICLVGGVDLISPRVVVGFSSLGLVSGETCKPFSKHRRSITISEGVAIAVLQRKSDVLVKPIAQFLGGAITNDAHHPTNPARDGIASCIEKAHARAGILGKDVRLVVAHGTGSRANDTIEGQLTLEKTPNASLTAPKMHIGHTMGAAGAFGAILACEALASGTVDPFVIDDPELPLRFATGSENLAGHDAIAQNNAFGFGGCNSVTLFRSVAS